MRISDWSSDVCSSDLFVLCHLQFFAVDLDEFAVLLLKAGMSLRDMVTDRAFLGFWRLEKIAGRAFLGVRVLPLLGFPVTLFGSAMRRCETVLRQADRTRVVTGKSVEVRVEHGGRRCI